MTETDHILLTLYGRTLDPDGVDSALGIKASSKYYVGQVPYSANTGERGKALECAVWLVSTRDHVHTTDLRDHVDWLLTHVDPSAVARLPGLEDVSLLLCITSTHDRAEVFIEPRFLRFAVEVGALMDLVFEYWPAENAGGEPDKAEPA